MVIDATGVILTPGEEGKFCLGNGLHRGIECCCEECDYARCCLPDACKNCTFAHCPREE